MTDNVSENLTAQAKAAAARLEADLLMTLDGLDMKLLVEEETDDPLDKVLALRLRGFDWTRPDAPHVSVVVVLSKPELVMIVERMTEMVFDMELGLTLIKLMMDRIEQPE